MYLFLIRHTESEKNIKNTFSSLKDEEKLTPKGESDAIEIAQQILCFAKRHSYKCHFIYSANSTRSKKTAERIAKLFNAEVQIEENLRSTRPGVLGGAKKERIKETHPVYAQQYYLFERGLYNVYDFINPENKEPKKDFEQRVNACVEKIISDKSEDIKIIVAHRSSITAILLNFARKYHHYPENFSGHVPLDLGCVSILRETDNNWEILKVNEKCNIINDF